MKRLFVERNGQAISITGHYLGKMGLIMKFRHLASPEDLQALCEFSEAIKRLPQAFGMVLYVRYIQMGVFSPVANKRKQSKLLGVLHHYKARGARYEALGKALGIKRADAVRLETQAMEALGEVLLEMRAHHGQTKAMEV